MTPRPILADLRLVMGGVHGRALPRASALLLISGAAGVLCSFADAAGFRWWAALAYAAVFLFGAMIVAVSVLRGRRRESERHDRRIQDRGS
jgi:hypothetical protein